MIVERFNELRARLDALATRARGEGMLAWARARLARLQQPSLAVLHELDAALERIGIHSAADARLLKELRPAGGEWAATSEQLEARAGECLAAFEQTVAVAERSVDAGAEIDLSALEADFGKLGRIVKVWAIFLGDEEVTFLLPFRRRRVGGRPHSTSLAAAEFFAERALSTVEDANQRRRDLDIAHELLLGLSTVAKGDKDKARSLRLTVADARAAERDVPAHSTLQELLRFTRQAARQDPQLAYRSMRALYERALQAGDQELAEMAAEATQALLPDGAAVVQAMQIDLHAAKLSAGSIPMGGTMADFDKVSDALAELAFDLDADRERAMLLAQGAGRFFDISDALAQTTVSFEHTARRSVPRRVSYPTQTMTFEHSNNLRELSNFVIQDPRRLLLDLASNRQLVRGYLEEEPPPKKKQQVETAVRVYVMDASGSMHGARAKFRDSILIAELNALRVRARLGLPFDPVYVSYFNDRPTDLSRVDNPRYATRYIEKLFGESQAQGQTDITLALQQAFESVRAARGHDPHLARATVVLVTDGEDRVDIDAIRTFRAPVNEVKVTFSFISLGDENRDLKQLVLEERKNGERAFYHHLNDAEIALAPTEFDVRPRTLLPKNVPVSEGAAARLAPALEALQAVAARRTIDVVKTAASRFETLFPKSPPPKTVDVALAELVCDVLEAVAETAVLVPPEARAGEAVTLLLHLLGLYEVSVDVYVGALGHPLPALEDVRKRIDTLCRPFTQAA